MNKIRVMVSIFLAAFFVLLLFSPASARTPDPAPLPADLLLFGDGNVSGEPLLLPDLAYRVYLPRLVTPPYPISPQPGVYSPAGANLEISYHGVNCFYAHVAPLGDWPDQRMPYEDVGGDCHGDQVTIWLDIAAEIAFDQIRIDFYNEYAVLISSRTLYVGQYTFQY